MAVTAEKEATTAREKLNEDSDDEDEFLEYSPCGTITKLRQQVKQQAVPGIDNSFLAMDTENGVEVVWNEVRFSENKNRKKYMARISAIFDSLQSIDHPNIVGFHKYWFDQPDKSDKPRVNFITEYMSSGSMKHFLKRTRVSKKKMAIDSWRRWCRQVLWALSYFHSSSPPIIHGNLTCDSMFIQHNGLLKIASAAPDVIHQHVKTVQPGQLLKNAHFVAPEEVTRTAVDERRSKSDIYSFGMCALEIAALEIQGNGDSGTPVTKENIENTIESLENEEQKDFIRACLRPDPEQRPTARQLLFHPVMFEVPSLKLLAAHAVVNDPNISPEDAEVYCNLSPDLVIAEMRHEGQEPTQLRVQDVTSAENIGKFVEDVRVGIYPLTAYAPPAPPPISQVRAASPDTIESVHSDTPEPCEREGRKVVTMMCEVKSDPALDASLTLVLFLRLDDKTNRQLSCRLAPDDSGSLLTEELVRHGLVNEMNRDELTKLIDGRLRALRTSQPPTPVGVS
ncbi:nuclear receptor-binding protein-like [Amphibalanus amphitrite]|nr:nuclear receptor-binding protein-like [Amphibalanus amphitrite]XP_043244560.1 nuclear receptor-binding protein-like [Amphibalanus amphitrite]